ncbi:uncharacterized protein LOC118438006 [Folsomia candida]|nr:uncharacterized protein LOC118438006 [Folsomia candida]
MKDLVIPQKSSNIIRKSEKFATLIIKANTIAAVTGPIFMNLVYILKPTAPQYIYHAYPDHSATCANWAFLVMEIYMKSINIIGAMLFQGWFLCSVLFELTVLSMLKKSSSPLHTKITYYKYLSFVNHLHNQCYPAGMLPLRVGIFGCMTITSSVILIRMIDRIHVFEQVIILQFLITMITVPFLFLSIAGKIVEDSLDLKESMGQENTGRNFKVNRKILKSLKPFGVKVGPIRAVNYNAFNAFVTNVISGLTTVLVSYPNLK